MPFCPKCRSEYRKDITHCPTCDVDLVGEAELPEQLTDDQVIAAMAEEDLEVVAEGTLQGLKPVQDVLIAEGIPAALRKAEELMTEAGLFLRLELVVRKSDLETAGPVVREALQGELSEEMREGLAHIYGEGDSEEDEAEEGDGPAPCPACGCTDPLVNGECPECGLFLGDE